MSPEQTVQRAARINAFLQDEAIVDALSRMERRYYEEFKQSKSSEDRVRAWAKANVLSDFEQEIKTVLDAGEIEVLKAAKGAKATSRKP